MTHLAVHQEQMQSSTPRMVCHKQASESAQNCRVQGPGFGTQQAGWVDKGTKRDLGLRPYETPVPVVFLFLLGFPPPDLWLWTAWSGSHSRSTGHPGKEFAVGRGVSRGQGGCPAWLGGSLCMKLSIRGSETVCHSSQVRQGRQQCRLTACPVQGRSKSRGCS